MFNWGDSYDAKVSTTLHGQTPSRRGHLHGLLVLEEG